MLWMLMGMFKANYCNCHSGRSSEANVLPIGRKFYTFLKEHFCLFLRTSEIIPSLSKKIRLIYSVAKYHLNNLKI